MSYLLTNVKEIEKRIVRTKRLIGCLNVILWSNETTKKRKFNIYETMIKSTLLYGAEPEKNSERLNKCFWGDDKSSTSCVKEDYLTLLGSYTLNSGCKWKTLYFFKFTSEMTLLTVNVYQICVPEVEASQECQYGLCSNFNIKVY